MKKFKATFEEEELLHIYPSQWINFVYYLLPLLGFVHPWGFTLALLTIYKRYEIQTWSYVVTTHRTIETHGVINRESQEVLHYRIKSIMIEEPFWLRILGLAHVHVISSEQFKPKMSILAVSDSEGIRNFLSTAAREWRQEVGIKEYDVFNS